MTTWTKIVLKPRAAFFCTDKDNALLELSPASSEGAVSFKQLIGLAGSAPKLLAALKRLRNAEDQTIEVFTAKEIDELEAAMKQAGEAIAEAEQK